MDHHFDIEVAKEVGPSAATIYKNIQYWCEKNRANEKHFYNNRFWVKISNNDIVKSLPYLTVSKVKSSISKLEKHGYIIVGNFDKNSFDKTNWYSNLR